MERILVIGATGNVGRQVTSQLLAKNVGVRALTRNPDTADLPSEVEVVRGDLAIPETLHERLEGVDAECVGSRTRSSCAYHFYGRGHHWNSGTDIP